MKARLTEQGNIEVSFKPHQKSEPVTVFLRPYFTDCYFSPSSHGNRHGSMDALGVQRAYAEHLAKLEEVAFPGINVDVMHEDTDGESRTSHFGYDDNPSLVVRGGNVAEAQGQVRRYAHFEGEGYNHVGWGGYFYSDGMTATEKSAFAEAFDQALLHFVPRILARLKKGRRKQAKEALDKFIRECAGELKKLRAIHKTVTG